MKKIKFTLMSMFLVLVTMGIICVSVTAWYIFIYLDPQLNLDFDTLTMDLSSIIYTQNPQTGEYEESERLYNEQNRIWVPLTEVPENLQYAFISIEDERFEKHDGVDWKRTFGAIVNFATQSGKSYGGSTITQQLVKNITGEDEVRPDRKIKEIMRALKVERTYEKDEILEIYVNTIFLGNTAYGVQTGAQTYFGKNVEELSLAQCAALAGITNNPTKYNPFRFPENTKIRQEVILSKMLELGHIPQADYDAAMAEPLTFIEKGSSGTTSAIQSWFSEEIRNQVVADLMEEKGYSEVVAQQYVLSGGLKIYSTEDTMVQSSMEDIFEDANNFPKLRGETQPQSSMVVMDPYTGEIKGIVGSRGEKTINRGLNYASRTYRQPGSALKPLAVYGPALENDIITYGSSYEDAALEIKNGKPYPKNSPAGYDGVMSVSTAVMKSKNTVAMRVMGDLTPEFSVDFLKNKLHFARIVEKEVINGRVHSDIVPSLALGGVTHGVSVLEMTAGYSAIANKGVYQKPHAYSKVLDHEGKVILDYAEKEGERVFSEDTAYITTRLMYNVVNGTRGATGLTAKLKSGIAAVGKTGTTNSKNDLWFGGFTPYYASVVWFGYSEPKAMPGNIQNTNTTIKIWKQVMDKIHEGKEKQNFDTMPEGVVIGSFCELSGMKPRSGCVVKSGYFKKGTVPTQTCNSHSVTLYCEESGLLANKECPKTTSTKPGEEGITKRCNLHTAPPEEEEFPSVTGETPSVPSASEGEVPSTTTQVPPNSVPSVSVPQATTMPKPTPVPTPTPTPTPTPANSGADYFPS